jgi:hypothetical protein
LLKARAEGQCAQCTWKVARSLQANAGPALVTMGGVYPEQHCSEARSDRKKQEEHNSTCEQSAAACRGQETRTRENKSHEEGGDDLRSRSHLQSDEIILYVAHAYARAAHRLELFFKSTERHVHISTRKCTSL